MTSGRSPAQLAAESVDEKLPLVVSDDGPTDCGRYEARCGIAEVRHALREAKRLAILPHALAVDGVARDYLPSMFGTGGWRNLFNPNQLPEALTAVHGRSTGQ